MGGEFTVRGGEFTVRGGEFTATPFAEALRRRKSKSDGVLEYSWLGGMECATRSVST
jgi:hypothetical protein